MEAILKPYEEQINEIARFAKSINYDISEGTDKLMKLWIEQGRKNFVFMSENKEQVIRTVKKFIK